MTKILISPEAKNDLLEIGNYITFTLHNESAARNVINKIRKTVFLLRQFPNAGTPLNKPVTRILYHYLICGNYMIFYHLADETAHIDRILYGRRDYLTLLFGDKLNEE